MLVHAKKGILTCDVDYDPAQGLEVLTSQIISSFPYDIDGESIQFIDFAGRLVSTPEDVESIKINSRQYASHQNDIPLLRSTDEPDCDGNINAKDQGTQASGGGDSTILTLSASATSQSQLSDSDKGTGLIQRRSLSNMEMSNEKVNLWCVDAVLQKADTLCTRGFFGLGPAGSLNDEDTIQPAYRMIDTDILLCSRCAALFDVNLVSAEHANLCSFTCGSDRAVEMGLSYPEVKEILRMEEEISVQYKCVPLFLFMKRNLLSNAMTLQLRHSNFLLSSNAIQLNMKVEAESAFRSKLLSGVSTIGIVEDKERQRRARSVIDYDKIREYMDEYMQGEDGPLDEDCAFMHGLMKWFKRDFFKWCNKPNCVTNCCGGRGEDMKYFNCVVPSEVERTLGMAGRTEIYRCEKCEQVTRFPRYNDPAHLLVTRTGRCGEWANCFCLICRALLLDARYVLDFTDHVWIEVWVPSLRRYVHADPCERTLDKPLMYENGWNKSLTHILSFSRHGVVDGSPRYTRKFNDIILRRGYSDASSGHLKSLNVSENYAAIQIKQFDAVLEQQFISKASTSPSLLAAVSLLSLAQLALSPETDVVHSNSDVSVMTMLERKHQLIRELESFTFLSSTDEELQLEGRISGDAEWKAQRGEDGKPLSDLKSSNSMFGVEMINETAESDGGDGDRDSNVILRYIPLGGSNHRDTVNFDSAECLWRMVESLSLCVSTAALPVRATLPLSVPSPSSAALSPGATAVGAPLPTKVSLKSTLSAPPLSPPVPKDESLFDMLLAESAKMTALISFENLNNRKKSCQSKIDSSCREFPFRKHKKVTSAEAAIWKALRVSHILIFAGQSLANGLSVEYSASTSIFQEILEKRNTGNSDESVALLVSPLSGSKPGVERESVMKLQSPLFSSDDDHPTRYSLILSPTQKVIKISVRAGDLIDSIHITVVETATEQFGSHVEAEEIDVTKADSGVEVLHSFGGQGGSVQKTLAIPQGWEFFGFYGGKGGHLHNLGVILKRQQ